jgi:hypothetical protein
MPCGQPFFIGELLSKRKGRKCLGKSIKGKRGKKMNKSPYLVGFTIATVQCKP